MVRRSLALALLALALTGCSAPEKGPARDLTPAEEVAILESLDKLQIPPR